MPHTRNLSDLLRRRSLPSGFSLVELLVVIGIIALLISVLLPSLAKARQASRDVGCLANLRSIGQALSIYASQNHGWWPKPAGSGGGGGKTPTELYHRKYLFPALYKREPDPTSVDTNYTYLNNTIFQCPAALAIWDGISAADTGYGMSANINLIRNGPANGRNFHKRPAAVKSPTEVAAVLDMTMPWAGAFVTGAGSGNITSPPSTPQQATWNDQPLNLRKALPRHRNKLNVLYVDLHAEPLAWADVPLPPPGASQSVSPTYAEVCSQGFWRFWCGTE